MSPVLSCATLLLVLLDSFQNACSARPRDLGLAAEIVHDEDSLQKSNLTTNKKDGDEMNLSDAQAGISSRVQRDAKENMEVREKITKHSSRKRENAEAKLGSGGGGASRRVTYRVPHRKRGERKPGFNLDYSPPKLHPPHHN